jgi:REP element-mobilizing transposase RayT
MLSEIFEVEVYAYAVMSNHFHLVLGVDPVGASALDAETVVDRWWRLFPGERDAQGNAVALPEARREAMLRDASQVKQWRERLGNLSWFMRCLNEPIARRANREDACTGRFWEGRFKSQRLADHGALLACMAYVDLNPVRAAIAETPETSAFTSAYDRIAARQAREALRVAKSELPKGSSGSEAQKRALAEARSRVDQDHWLVSLKRVPRGEHALGKLDLSSADYLSLLDATGRVIRTGKAGAIPEKLAPLLERMDLDHERWVENVRRYGSLFYHIAGKVENLVAAARAVGQRWFCVRSSEGRGELYRDAAPAG